jgi:hypothetical protein
VSSISSRSYRSWLRHFSGNLTRFHSFSAAFPIITCQCRESAAQSDPCIVMSGSCGKKSNSLTFRCLEWKIILRESHCWFLADYYISFVFRIIVVDLNIFMCPIWISLWKKERLIVNYSTNINKQTKTIEHKKDHDMAGSKRMKTRQIAAEMSQSWAVAAGRNRTHLLSDVSSEKLF